ncbi:hypothetical protein [Flavobacterium sp. F52]|uniref:hypothetical protein n=1 Tax=Flavobacterium sp. F52 TaxID=1202532 RepID=UPI0002DAE258|nr:hypothetical protein [Flavobacterium sp. F52]
MGNNATGITVPIKDNPEDPEYKGQKMLYLYESDSKYQALLQEILPESRDKIDDDQKKLGFEDLTLFSGYIITWDLKKGFLKGAKLKDGIVIGDVRNIITLYDQDVKSDMTSKMIEMFDDSSNYGGERDDTLQRGGTAAIPLNNVIVVQKSPAPTPKDFSIAGAFGGDGGSNGSSGTPTGGGGSGSNGDSPKSTIIITDLSFLNNSCLSSVYAQLGGSPIFQNYLKNFDGNFSVANLRLSASNTISNGVNAETSPPSNYLIEISFNSNNLNRPGIDIARTFMHEMIHAEMFRKLLSLSSTKGEIDVTKLNQMLTQHNFPGLYDYYTRYGINGMQHEQMAAHYQNTMISFLKNYDSKLTAAQYEAIAWAGLKGTSSWNALTQAKKTSLINIYNSWLASANKQCQ